MEQVSVRRYRHQLILVSFEYLRRIRVEKNRKYTDLKFNNIFRK